MLKHWPHTRRGENPWQTCAIVDLCITNKRSWSSWPLVLWVPFTLQIGPVQDTNLFPSVLVPIAHSITFINQFVACPPASIAPNSRCFEGLLLVFDSGYSGVCILVGDDHLPGMLPACKQLYFLEHLQNHNRWYCARSTPTVMLSCWLCIDCLLNTWNQMMDQFNKLISNVTCSFSFESCWNPIPERRSPTCCCSAPRTILKAFLQIAFVWAGLNLFEVLSIWF